MSNPEQQAPTLETCKALVDAGVEFDSKRINKIKQVISVLSLSPPVSGLYESINFLNTQLRPTTQELLEKMPVCLENFEGGAVYLRIDPHSVVFQVSYEYLTEDETPIDFYNKNLAEALAQTLLWLHKEGYLGKSKVTIDTNSDYALGHPPSPSKKLLTKKKQIQREINALEEIKRSI